MPTDQAPMHVRLALHGLNVTSIATTFLGAEDAAEREPALIRLLIADESELHIPMTAEAFAAMREALKPYSDWPQIGE